MALKQRSSGVLMHISSLPGNYGIGTLGKEAFNFIDSLSEMGFSNWQILPLGPTDDCNSPYKSSSAFAGNPLLIDLEGLHDLNLLTTDDLHLTNFQNSRYSIDFEAVKANRNILFNKAFKNLTPLIKKDIQKFVYQNESWLPDFSLYTTLSEEFSDYNWALWKNNALSFRDIPALSKAKNDYANQINYHNFLQYIFYYQWFNLKNYANKNGITIIGDLPFYVSHESADVWCHPELFQLDSKGIPLNVAGVPPDYFSKDGQLWGYPLYLWDYLKTHHYTWWTERIEFSLNTYNMIRIDHFRGFSAFWSIPITEKTAKNGQWITGPGIDFFNHLAAKFNSLPIIAEDLGTQDQSLNELLAKTNFPGMRIMGFAFLDTNNNHHYPHNYTKNTVAYTGTHDNNTLLGTFFNYSNSQRNQAFEYCGFHNDWENQWQIGGSSSYSVRAFLRTLWSSVANLVIIPIQDICGFGEDTKMNQPGTSKNNWGFRMTKEGLTTIDRSFYLSLNRLYFRINK
jgi:4-alpha-glucanotransferase